MAKHICPYCGSPIKKKLDLSEVIEKKAQNLADQEIDKKLKIEKKVAEEKGAKDAEKRIKEKYKGEALRTKNIEEENKKLKQKKEEDKKKAAEAAQATEFERSQKKLRIEQQKHQDEKQLWKIKEERYRTDIEKVKRRADQGLTADQGTGGEITMGNYLEKIFKDVGDEIIVYGKGEAGGDRLQKVKKEGIEIGRILYEKKETKSFLESWISKIQTDMKESKASVGIIFTTALPRDFDKELGYISKKNIFICKYDFDALRYLAYTRRQALEVLYEKNQGKKESNKKSAEEFFEEPTTQNIFNLIDSKFVNHGGSLKSAKLAISKAETSYLEILKEIDELFKITEPFGLKRKK